MSTELPELVVAEAFGVIDDLVKGGAQLRVYQLDRDYWVAQIEEIRDSEKYGNLCCGRTQQEAVVALVYRMFHGGRACG